MKRIILMLGMLVCVLAAHAVFAQQQGVITYEHRVNQHRSIPEDRQEMKAMIPEFRTSNLQLFFNAEESLYKPVIEDAEEQFAPPGGGPGGPGGGGPRMMFRTPKTETYTNTSTSMIIALQELMGKKYVIQDTVKVSPWKLGTETKEVMGYTCRMAYYTTTQEIQSFRSEGGGPPIAETKTVPMEITAWYTDKIRPALGPERYNTLPGTVLAIDINNGEQVIVARNIELRKLKKDELKVPDNGTKVSKEEFRKIQQEQMEKMRANGRSFRN